MAKMPKELMDLLNDPQTVKVLATADAARNPNAVPKGSITAIDDQTIAFADIMGEKTNANLRANKKVALVVTALTKTPPAGYQVKGAFQGYQTSGTLFDTFTKKLEPRKLKPKAVGTIKVEEVYSCLPPKKLA